MRVKSTVAATGRKAGKTAHESVKLAPTLSEALLSWNSLDHRSELGPDGVLLWEPRTKVLVEHGDLTLTWLTAKYPDMAMWRALGHRWLSIIYDQHLREAAAANKRAFPVAARLASAASSSLKVFFYEYLGQKEGKSWKFKEYRENPEALLTPLSDLDDEVALRDDFWDCCCQPLMRRKLRPDKRGYQFQSVQASTLSENISDFLNFAAKILGEGNSTNQGSILRNPFWARGVLGTKNIDGEGQRFVMIGKDADKAFSWLDRKCPQLKDWKPLAVEFVSQLRASVPAHLAGMGVFFERYLNEAGRANSMLAEIPSQIARNPGTYLLRRNKLPDNFKDLCKSDSAAKGVVDFLDWILLNHFSVQDDSGHAVVPIEYKNPLSAPGWKKQNFTHTIRQAMPYLWLERLRMILVEGETFSHWTWAQNAEKRADRAEAPDWFEVDESLIDRDDPDCVWRQRVEVEKDKTERQVFEIWSPVRWVSLLTKLTTALRTVQVRMLDSGESDQWRFDIHAWATSNNPWILNEIETRNPELSKACRAEYAKSRNGNKLQAHDKTWDNGVLRRIAEYTSDGVATATVLYPNTNKTADIAKEGAGKGYNMPLPLEACPLIEREDGSLSRPVFETKKEEYLWLVSLSRNIHFWLAKLRDWQSKYNAIGRRTKWKEIEGVGLFGTKTDEQYAAYRDACFLFREPSLKRTFGAEHRPAWPLTQGVVATAWWYLCKELQDKFKAAGITQEGEMIRLVEDDQGNSKECTYDLHAIRVSLVSAWVIDGEIEPEIAMQLTGHSRLVMLLFYVKWSRRSAQDAIAKGAEKIDVKKSQNELEFLRNASLENIQKRIAFNSEETLIEAFGGSALRRFTGWMRLPEGLCPVGGNTVKVLSAAGKSSPCGCFNGGPAVGKGGVYGPVEGGDHNCPNCRWFITTPAHLEGLVAKFNVTAYEMKQALDKARAEDKLLHDLEGDLYEAGTAGAEDSIQASLLLKINETQKLVERYGALYTTLASTLLNTRRLIMRLLEVQSQRADGDSSEMLVLSGGESEWGAVIEQTDSELLQLQLLAESYAVYPEFDPREAIWRRSQILDAALAREGLPTFFLQLSKEDQVHAGNEFMLRIGRELSPDSVGNGILKGVQAIDAKQDLGTLLHLNKKGLERLVRDSSVSPEKRVIRLVLESPGANKTKSIAGVEHCDV